MKFERFDWLARGNRAALLLAMELLMQSGRGFVQNTERAEIIRQLKNTAGPLIAENMLAEIADIAKELAELRTCKLLEYVKRSGLEFERPGSQEPGVCPICGGEIEYEDGMQFEDSGHWTWKCPDCKACGKEEYKKVFTRHFEVTDGNGKPFFAPAP